MIRRLLPLIMIVALNILIGSYVLRRNPRRVANQSFAFFAFSVAAWTLFIAITHSVDAASTLSARITFATASVMVFALFLLFRTFPDEARLRWHWSLSIFGFAALILSALSFSSLIVSDAKLKPDGLEITYGPLHPLYGLYTYSCFAVSILLLIKKYRASAGLVRLQFHYLLLGLLLPGLGVTFTNLLIPLIVGTSRTGQYGPYFAVIFLAFTAHALIHYRFMDTRLVIKRGMTFVLALVASVLVLSVGLVAAWAFVPFSIERSHVLLLVLGSVLIGSLIPVLREVFANVLDRYVYRSHLNYPRALREISQALVGILDLDDLVAYTARTTLRTLRAERAAVYLLRDGCFRLYCEHTDIAGEDASSPVTLPTDTPLVEFLTNHREPLVTEEIPQRFPGQMGRSLVADMNQRRWGLVVPIHSENTLQGLLAVGPKMSTDPFFPDELEFLSILANQVGIAVKNAELYKQVLLANESIENILSTMESGVVAVDSQRRVTLCNKAAERMTGLKADVIRHQNIESLPAALWHPLDATLADGRPRTQIESALGDDDGRIIPVVSSTSPLRDASGSILGAVMVFSDLSRLKELEREKRRGERLAAFGAFASGIAHEIKNPLVAIRTFAELLPERFTDDEFRGEFSAVVLREIERIDHLVARLRGLAVPSHISFRNIDIIEPIEETLALLRAQFIQKHIRVARAYGASRTLVSGDADQLKQLFLNLFINALEAMDNQGELRIRLGDRATHDGRILLVEITDTGSGIPETLIGKIFDPFVTTKPKGSGLGLAICRGITDAHKATIRAANVDRGRGTAILIEFPTAPDMEPATTV